MKKQLSTPLKFAVYALALSSASACSWVDSKGTQAADFTDTADLSNAQPITIAEQSTVTASLIGEGSTLSNWSWTMDSDDARSSCDGMNGFEQNFAKTSLTEACSDRSDCSVDIQEMNTDSGTAFSIKMPSLRAPVALAYNFTAFRRDGAVVRREQVLCGISINEAPVAQNDAYTFQIDSTTIVNGDDFENLLNNDTDDNDIRNTALMVITTPVKLPSYAAQFQLQNDGGFSYQASPNVPLNGNGFILDSFTYAVTDGLHTVEATATIKIIGPNESPLQLLQLPDVELSADNGEDNSHKRILNIAQFFFDPDGDELSFSSEELSPNSTITLSADGKMISEASLTDVNQQRITIVASDGKQSTSGDFVLTVRIPDLIKNINNNATPTVTDIKNRTFTSDFTYDVSPFFFDKDEQDLLTYTATNLPAGLRIRADGVIEGQVNSSNQGRWYIRVMAKDGYGGSVDDGFLLYLY